MKKIKFKPLLLAVAMIINTLPFSPLKTAAAATSEIKWSFVDGNGSSTDRPAYIITGESVAIKEDIPTSYTYSQLNVIVGKNEIVNFDGKKDDEKITYRDQMLSIGENLFYDSITNETSDKINKEVTYAISGQYLSKQAKGTLIETFTYTTTDSSGATVSEKYSASSESIISRINGTDVPIMAHSTLTLKCIQSATPHRSKE